MTAEPDRWKPQTPLLQLSPTDVWTLRDAYEGIQIFGGTGSGKTSGSGAAIARTFLREGFGGVVCCAKPEERELWQKYARETNREDSIVIFSPDHSHRFNFLRYELERAGKGAGHTENLVNLLSLVTEIAEGSGAHNGGGDRYWERAARQMLRNAIDLLTLSRTPLTLESITQLIADAPRSAAQIFEKSWQNSSLLWAALKAAKTQAATAREKHDVETANSYWFTQFAGMDERPRSSIISTFASTADMLAHGLAWELMGTDVTLIPEWTLMGKIIILDLPIQEYGEVGRVIQGVWKTMFQRAVLRRDVREFPRPVFLWCDESQNFISSLDFEYQATARSARACTVYLTQNLPNYRAKLGPGSEDAALALLGNFQTKIWHANGDYVTNTYASDTIGKRIQWLEKEGVSAGEHGASASGGRSQHVDYVVPPHAFATLKKGGIENHRTVEGVVFQAGKRWNCTRDTYLMASFTQQ